MCEGSTQIATQGDKESRGEWREKEAEWGCGGTVEEKNRSIKRMEEKVVKRRW